jgi:HSP20 family protein
MDELDIWDPMRRMQRKMNRFMEEFWPLSRETRGVREPLLDVIDKDKSIEVIAELPGVEKNQINVEVEDDSLTLSAEVKEETKEGSKDKGYYFHERTYQSFYRKIPLPDEVIAEKAEASFKNGVLKIEIPKKSPSKPSKGFKVQVK